MYNVVKATVFRKKKMNDTGITLNKKIMTDSEEISELVGKISAAGQRTAPTLRRENRIKTIQGTLAIEQNTLNIKQVTAVLNGKHVIAPPRDIAEVRNAYKAYEMLDEFDPYSAESLLEAHGVMMRGLIDDAGMFRSCGVAVADSEGNIIHVGTLPRYVPESIEKLLSKTRKSTLSTVIKSSIFHYEFEVIHPFSDGNGRMGRLWHTLMLKTWDPLFAWLPVESIINDRQKEYYLAINRSNDTGDPTVFVEFMLSAIKTALLEAYENK